MVKNKLAAILNLTEDNTALRPLTNNRPIAALPFAGRYRIIDFALSDIAYAGIDSVAIFIGDSGRSIYDHIRSGEAWDLESNIGGGVFTFSQQNWKKEYKIQTEHEDFYYNHSIYLERSRAELVYVAGSKIISNVDIKAIAKQHQTSQSDVTVVYKNIERPKSTVVSDEDCAIIFGEDRKFQGFAPLKEKLEDQRVNVSLGQFVISNEVLQDMIQRALKEEVYLDIDDLIRYYLHDYKVNGYECTGYVASISSIDTYYRANMEMLSHQKFSGLFQSSIPILTKSKHGTPTYYSETSHVSESIMGTGAMIYGDVHRSIINRRVVVDEGASVEDSIVLQGSTIGEGAEIKYAILDKNVYVEARAKIIGSPDNIIVVGKDSIVHA